MGFEPMIQLTRSSSVVAVSKLRWYYGVSFRNCCCLRLCFVTYYV